MQNRLVIALIRHGEYKQPPDVPSALLPYPLTEQGCAQARVAATTVIAFAKQHGLEILPRLDCSKQLRAWQTANLLSAELKQADTTGPDVGYFIVEHEVLSERSVGAMANLTVTEIEKILSSDPRYTKPPKNWKSSRDYCLPFQGAESLTQAGQRVARHLESILAMVTVDGTTDKTPLKIVVGHGASIRHACVQLGILSAREVSKLSMYNASPIFIAHSDNRWEQMGGQWKQRGAGDAGDELNGK